MTGEDLLEYVIGKAILKRDIFWGLYEVVGQGQLGKNQRQGSSLLRGDVLVANIACFPPFA